MNRDLIVPSFVSSLILRKDYFVRTRRSSKSLVAGVAAVGSAGLVAATLIVSAGTGSADPVELTLNYTCPFPLIGDQPLKVVINSDIPSTLEVGQESGEIPINAISTVSAKSNPGVEHGRREDHRGQGTGQLQHRRPRRKHRPRGPTTIEKTPIPPEGEFDVNATGTAPSITPSKAGTATITVCNLLLTLTPRKEDGSETGLGTFESACTLDEGQNNVLAEIEITGDGGGEEAGGAEAGGEVARLVEPRSAATAVVVAAVVVVAAAATQCSWRTTSRASHASRRPTARSRSTVTSTSTSTCNPAITPPS